MLTVSATAPFRLGAVVESHGWFQTAPFAWNPDDGALRRVERFSWGLATVTLSERDGAVEAVCEPRPPSGGAAEVRARAARMLQADTDPSGLVDAVSFDPGLASDLDRYRAGRLLAGSSLYEDVVKGICGTNITWRQAVGCIAGLAQLDGDGAFPEPRALADAGEDTLREVARVGYRAPFLVSAAHAALDGRLDDIDADAPSLSTDELAVRLKELPGVGPSTAAFLCLLMGRYDLPLVDSAVRRMAARRWFEGRTPTDAEVLARVAPAGHYSGLALYWATMRGWHDEGGIEGSD